MLKRCITWTVRTSSPHIIARKEVNRLSVWSTNAMMEPMNFNLTQERIWIPANRIKRAFNSNSKKMEPFGDARVTPTKRVPVNCVIAESSERHLVEGQEHSTFKDSHDIRFMAENYSGPPRTFCHNLFKTVLFSIKLENLSCSHLATALISS